MEKETISLDFVDSGHFSNDYNSLEPLIRGPRSQTHSGFYQKKMKSRHFSEKMPGGDIIEADCAMPESNIKSSCVKKYQEIADCVRDNMFKAPPEMTDSIPISQFENLSIRKPKPRKPVTVTDTEEYKKALTELNQTQDFSFGADSGFEGLYDKPELGEEEYNTRLKRTVFYSEIRPEDGESLLHNAILAGNETLTLCMVEDMVTYKYLSTKNNYQETALHLAVMSNMPKVVRRILAHGADICVRNRNGDTPLHLACKKGFKDCVEVLTRHLIYEEVKDIPYSVPFRLIPQNLNLRNYDGLTCLHLAVISNHFDIVNYLINELYAPVDTQEGKSGKTALHFAVEAANVNLVNFLVLTCGAKVNTEMYNRRTALDIAVGMKKVDLQRCLVNFGARTGYFESEDDSDMDISM